MITSKKLILELFIIDSIIIVQGVDLCGWTRGWRHYVYSLIMIVLNTMMRNQEEVEVIRIISARYATSFERGIYYGKY